LNAFFIFIKILQPHFTTPLMKRVLCLLAFLFVVYGGNSQHIGFRFGEINIADIGKTQYELDTAASAIYLKEYGEAYIDNDTYNLNFSYHAIIKILKTDGLEVADYKIPLYYEGNDTERLLSVYASSFNIENDMLREVALDKKNIFTQDPEKNIVLKKFAVPNVRVGSIIEVAYTIESPYVFNFHEWKFQCDYPKLYSEYVPSIPGNYIYNISLRGYLPLTKSESKTVENCLSSGRGATASCAKHTFAIANIPAFKEDDYMTAKSNFISAIHFELSEVRRFDGSVNKITKS